jgi:hypothetical protein
VWAALIALVAAAAPARAQAQDQALAPPKERPTTVESAERENERAKQIIDLQKKIGEAIEKHDYAEAERLMRQNLTLEPRNFVVYYNLACMRALQGDADGAGELLRKAIESGFIDIYRMRADPDLRIVRQTDLFKTIENGWPKILQAHLEANLKQASRIFDGKTGKYETIRDETLKIAILSAMDPVSTEQAHKDIARLRDWGVASVFPDLADETKGVDDAWVVVVLPTPRDFRKWAVATYGIDAIQGLSGIGGHYDHDQKRLVAMDLGATLRHEFFHVLHWRSTTRLGQDHPVWIQEGLCSLVEDYEPGDPNKPESLRPVPSWRSNIVKRLASNGKLLSIKALAAIRRDRFTSSNPLANYAQARTFLLYLFQQGKLKDWYTHYTTHYEEDPTGVASIEAVLGKPIAQVDRDYRAWLKTVPEVAEQNKPGDVGIGADVESGDGDGPVIVDIPRDQRGEPPNPARRAGLRVGDVIVAIDGQPTRDLNELVRVLGTHKAGDEIELEYRRGKTHATARVTLQPR